MKEAVTKVIDMLTQEDFHGAFQKLLERYNKCIVSGRDYFEGDWNFKSGNLFNDPRMSSWIVWNRTDYLYKKELGIK